MIPQRPTDVVRPLVRPPRLRPGDRVAVVAPSGPVDPDRLAAGRRILEGWGLEVVLAPHVAACHERLAYLAGTDADRAADLQEAWLDPGVAAVLCARGGYGAGRIVDRLDWAAMRAAPPKVFAGFSDATVLHEAFAVELGVATFYAPMVAAEVFVVAGPSADRLRQALFEPERVTVLTSGTAHTLVPGTARGVVLGGCLSLLAASIGTPRSRLGGAGGILLLEDVEEEPHRIDRALTQLRRSGWLSDVAGIALGSWRDCGPPDLLREIFLDRLGDLGVPVLHELGFGHCADPLTVPLGVSATLDADAAMLTLDQPALR